MPVFVSKTELLRRRRLLLSELEKLNLDGACLFSPHYVFYFSGFAFIATERPIALVIDGEGKSTLFIPLLEQEHAQEHQIVADQVLTYPEYPGQRHPLEYLADALRQAGLEHKRVGVDSDGYSSSYGYTGPKLSEVVQLEIVEIKNIIERMMMIKSREEAELLRESAKWSNLAHALLQEYTEPGLTETEIATRASHEASQAMIRSLGPSYRLTHASDMPAFAGFRGQIGAQSAIPHAITTNVRIRRGDVVVTGAGADVGGYSAELERTMIVGQPTERQRWFFNLILEAQSIALEAIKPGRKCSDVDRAVTEFLKQNGLREHWRHHTGHALGLRMHEAPFLDIGDETVIEPGMVFSVEPGIYVSGFAGFRHSDTVVVTESGVELLTYYPRDLDSLIID